METTTRLFAILRLGDIVKDLDKLDIYTLDKIGGLFFILSLILGTIAIIFKWYLLLIPAAYSLGLAIVIFSYTTFEFNR